MFHNCWNKAAVSQIFPVDFIPFSDYCTEIHIIKILIYSTKYRKILPWTRKQKIFCVNTYYKTYSVKIIQAKYRRKFNYNTQLNKSQELWRLWGNGFLTIWASNNNLIPVWKSFEIKHPSLSSWNNLERLCKMSYHKRTSAPLFKKWFHDIWLNISKCYTFPCNNLKRERE